MNEIGLKCVIPHVFAQQELTSEVWEKEIVFSKGTVCLLEAVSGAGKTSLYSYIYGYRSDYAGDILFDGKDIRELTFSDWSVVRRSSLSILFQELRLFPELTVLENILLKNNLTRYKEISWIERSVERLGLAEKRDVVAGKLSFGQQQRLALLRALCQPFDFLLLDEPVSHLDDANNRIIAELIEGEVKQQGAGVIVSSIGKHPFLDYDKVIRL